MTLAFLSVSVLKSPLTALLKTTPSFSSLLYKNNKTWSWSTSTMTVKYAKAEFLKYVFVSCKAWLVVMLFLWHVGNGISNNDSEIMQRQSFKNNCWFQGIKISILRQTTCARVILQQLCCKVSLNGRWCYFCVRSEMTNKFQTMTMKLQGRIFEISNCWLQGNDENFHFRMDHMCYGQFCNIICCKASMGK